jgi:anti-sigma B factor antagonist
MSTIRQCLIDDEWRGTTVILNCAGVIDVLTAPELQQCIDKALVRKPSKMIVDLTLVEFISSRGMCVLLEARDRCSPAAAFAVVAHGPRTLRPMRVLGLTDIISVRPSLGEVLTALDVDN